MIKKIAISFSVLIILALSLLWFLGKEMREVKTEVEIAATPEQVWQVITDVKNWDQWSPIIQKSEGETSLGSQLSITMVSEEGKGGKDGPFYQPTVTLFEPHRSFRWRAYMMNGFIFTNDKSFQIEPTANGCKLIHREHFQGLMLPLFLGRHTKSCPRYAELDE